MSVLKLEFLRSCPGPGTLPTDGLPEIAFAGRSNVGKSSLLNALNGGRTVARTSSRPGCTQFLNLYSGGGFYIIDLPGYGYAKAPEKLRRQWTGWIADYLEDGTHLRGVVLLADARHPCLTSDMEMAAYLRDRGRPYVVALTKADKLSRGKLAASVRKAGEMGPVVAVSSVKGTGLKELGRWLFEAVS